MASITPTIRVRARGRSGSRGSYANSPPHFRERRVVIELHAVSVEPDAESAPERFQIRGNRGCAHFVVEFDSRVRPRRLVADRQRAAHVPR